MISSIPQNTPEDSFAIGIDLGGTKTRFAIVNRSGFVLDEMEVPTQIEKGYEEIIQRMIIVIQNLQKKSSEAIVGLGVAIAGQVEAQSGLVHFAPNLQWHQVSLGDPLQKALSLPVTVMNDVRAATWAEWHYGAGKGAKDLLCLFLGTGIGGGIVSHGQLLTGHNNSAGEVGHSLLEFGGLPCTCGNHGCWETVAGGWGIQKNLRQAIQSNSQAAKGLLEQVKGEIGEISSRHLFAAVKEKDPFALEFMAGVEKALVAGVASLVNVLNPEYLLLGGGLVEGAPWLVQTIEKGISKIALESAIQKLKVLPVQLQKNSGVIGAATLALKRGAIAYFQLEGGI